MWPVHPAPDCWRPLLNIQGTIFGCSDTCPDASFLIISSRQQRQSTNLRLFLSHWQVPGVLQELGHVGHDGLLVGVSHVHICIDITILHDATALSQSESRTRCAAAAAAGGVGKKAEKLVCLWKHAALRESADELTGRAQRIKLGFFIKGWKQTRQRVSQLTARWSCRVPWGRLGSVMRADIRSAAHRLQRLRTDWHAALPDRRKLWDRVAANWFEDTG